MILTGCTTQNPKEVVKEFFKYYNQKNLEGMNSLTTEQFSESFWEFENLEYIKVINIIEDTNQTNKEDYLRQRKLGQKIDMDKEKLELENVTIFKVDFEVKYKKERVGPSDSGRDKYYYLIRKDKNSPWLISTFGH